MFKCIIKARASIAAQIKETKADIEKYPHISLSASQGALALYPKLLNLYLDTGQEAVELQEVDKASTKARLHQQLERLLETEKAGLMLLPEDAAMVAIPEGEELICPAGFSHTSGVFLKTTSLKASTKVNPRLIPAGYKGFRVSDLIK